MQALKKIFNREDPEFVDFEKGHAAKTPGQKTFYVLMHLAPGWLAYVCVYYLRQPLMNLTGLSALNAQFVFLVAIAGGWEILLTFLMLRYVEKLNFKQSLAFLGFNKFDLKGLVVIMPIILAIFTFISLPFFAYAYTPLSNYLNSLALLHMGPWHIYNLGYFSFPAGMIVVVAFLNFFGEEMYFRGYLLKKISGIKFDWLIHNFLFELYHAWQAPINWPFALLAPIIPFSILMKLRKNIYVSIAVHIIMNLFLLNLVYILLGRA